MLRAYAAGGAALLAFLALLLLYFDGARDARRADELDAARALLAAQAAELDLRQCLDRFADGLRWDFERDACVVAAPDGGGR